MESRGEDGEQAHCESCLHAAVTDALTGHGGVCYSLSCRQDEAEVSQGGRSPLRFIRLFLFCCSPAASSASIIVFICLEDKNTQRSDSAGARREKGVEHFLHFLHILSLCSRFKSIPSIKAECLLRNISDNAGRI